MQLGIDYAGVDGDAPPDWSAVARVFSFAIFRDTYRTTVDPVAKRDRDPARAAGLIVGEYMFPMMDTSSPAPADQVKVFASSADVRHGIDLPPMLDIEFPHGLAATGRSRPDLITWIRDAITALRNTYGCWPLLYTSQRVWDGSDADCLDAPPTPDLIDCPLVLSRYPFKERLPAVTSHDLVTQLKDPPVPLSWDGAWWIHQYQGDALGAVGFSSTVDLNRFHGVGVSSSPSRGNVRWAQRRLKLAETGVFDNITIDALIEFQKSKGLTADAVIGVKTFVALAWQG